MTWQFSSFSNPWTGASRDLHREKYRFLTRISYKHTASFTLQVQYKVQMGKLVLKFHSYTWYPEQLEFGHLEYCFSKKHSGNHGLGGFLQRK